MDDQENKKSVRNLDMDELEKVAGGEQVRDSLSNVDLFGVRQERLRLHREETCDRVG